MNETCRDIPSTLLDEVFDEVNDLEKSVKKPEKTTPGFLEDVAAEEINLVLRKENLSKSKSNKTESNVTFEKESFSSFIHDGLTDSSDDEENKYFEESKYNDCGRNINKVLKDKRNEKNALFQPEKRYQSNLSTFTRNKNEIITPEIREAREKINRVLENFKNTKGKDEDGVETQVCPKSLLVDPVLNMRIVNPLVSSTVLQSKMLGRISVGTSKIKRFLETPESKSTDWVTGGVIAKKFSKTSQKGNQYMIWELSDLHGDIKTISVFLFGSAHKAFWKTSEGTVAGILNPDVMDNNNGRGEATLRVDNALKILLMGTSKDFGICKAKTKNGKDCSALVNISRCEYCTSHLQKEYKKACRRSDLQPPKMGSLMDFKKKLLGKSLPLSYNTDKKTSFLRITGKKGSKQTEKDRQRLESLSIGTSPVQRTYQPDAPITSKSINQPVRGDAAEKPNETRALPNPRSQMIDLNIKITAADRAKAKAMALNYVRTHGPIKKPAQDERAKRTPEQIASVKRKLRDVVKEEEEDQRAKTKSGAEESDPKKKKLEKLGMTAKFFEMMNAPASDKTLLDEAERNHREKYFKKLETREKIEEKMASTFKVECNAVRCLKCCYKAFSASELCKREKHPLKVFKATKRFWKCSNCPGRTVSLELYPLHPCPSCGNPKWERASMMPEKGPNLMVEPLSLRGMEEKFIGSTIKNASLNLLVPDDTGQIGRPTS